MQSFNLDKISFKNTENYNKESNIAERYKKYRVFGKEDNIRKTKIQVNSNNNEECQSHNSIQSLTMSM